MSEKEPNQYSDYHDDPEAGKALHAVHLNVGYLNVALRLAKYGLGGGGGLLFLRYIATQGL